MPAGSLEAAAVDRAIATATRLAETRLYSGMVRPGLLPALPALEEEIAAHLARLAQRVRHREARPLFLRHLALRSSADLDAADRERYEEVQRQEPAVAARLDLLRVRRMLQMPWPRAQKERAAGLLRQLWDDPRTPRDVRAEAGFEWASYRRLQADRQELLDLFTQVIDLTDDRSLAERALYARGIVHHRGTRPEDTARFREDMEALLRRAPTGRLAADALNQLASGFFYAHELDRALEVYRRLQALDVPHDFQDSAYYVPALILVARNRDGDLDDADRTLAAYIDRYPGGTFRSRALFWRARIAERRSEAERARALFTQVIAEVPYDYYGLRARLHLEVGARAAGLGLPPTTSETRSRLGEQYRASRVARSLTGQSPYHDRLTTVVAAGIYPQLLETDERHRTRIDAVDLDDLDAAGLIPPVALLLALRQDALAARDADLGTDNRLRLAGFLGQEAKDWPVALDMIAPTGADGDTPLSVLQHDARYLATAYPDVAALGSIPRLFARAAWPVDGSDALSQTLMYAVARQESRFHPAAISQAGAMGLFQFMPATFRGLRGDQLLRSSGIPSDAEYLLDASRNVALWARWIQDEHRLTRREEIADVLMRHQAGSGNVGRWRAFWQDLGVGDDLELRIETARFPETRNFVRWTLRNLVIVDASGMFD